MDVPAGASQRRKTLNTTVYLSPKSTPCSIPTGSLSCVHLTGGFVIRVEPKKLNQKKATAFFSVTWVSVTHGFTPSFTPRHKMICEHSRDGPFLISHIEESFHSLVKTKKEE